jgi:hypothetical protein
VSDDDADYIELERALEGGARINRHVVMARRDWFLFVADAVAAERPRDIAYELAIPLPPGVQFVPRAETRDGLLKRSGSGVCLLPLALPEWRSEPGRGSLAEEAGRLVLRQQAENASALFAPLWLDLAPWRTGREPTWRRLTVAEARRRCQRDVAVGYRVQLGKDQWLVYRSLSRSGVRTILGRNLTSEFLVARFSASGEAASVIEIA